MTQNNPPMHRLLLRQMRRHVDDPVTLSERYPAFIAAINQAYQDFEQDRQMIERSMELSSQELSAANADLRGMIQACPDMFLRVSTDGTILTSNTPDPGDLLVPTAHLVGKKIQDVPVRAVADLFKTALAQILKKGDVATFEYALDFSEAKKMFEARMLKIDRSHVLVIIRNVTKRHELENMVIGSKKMAAVGQLAAGVAHEINNPLGIILGYAQGLVRKLKNGDSAEFPLKAIEREAIRCKNLVQDLLMFSRVSKVEREPVNINDVIKASLSLVVPKAKIAGITVDTDLVPDLPRILGNANQIQQIVINLANNGIDAVEEGGTIKIRTAVVSERSQSWVTLTVIDDGAGIPPDIQGRIFEPFFTTKDVGRGTGLGLSLVHEIVEKHAGTIRVVSRPGFTEFTTQLPVHVNSTPPQGEPNEYQTARGR